MKKIIYITEDVAKEISNFVKPLPNLPRDIKSVLQNHKTSLGVHPAFPPEEEMSFDMLLTMERYDEVKNEVLKLDIDDYSEKNIQKEIRLLTDKCKEIEQNFKEKLENICFNYIIDLFRVPEGLVAFECKLVEKVDDDKAQIQDLEKFEFNDIAQRTKLHDAVYKRRIINAIITGGAMRLSFISKELIGELYEISPELPSIYRKIIVLNNYLLFLKNNMGISEKNKKQAGISYLTIGNENTKNKIIVEAEIFPILLHESVRGFLEMFAAYGLPSSKKECTYVMSKADFINAEPWDMRLGPALWDKLMNAFGNPNNEDIPMILTILFSQNTDKFNFILREIFGETKLGDYLAKKIMKKVETELEIDDFEETMHKKQIETSLINDNLFKSEEL